MRHGIVKERKYQMRMDSFLRCPLDLLRSFVAAVPSRLGVFLRRVAYRSFMAGGGRFDLEAGVRIDGLSNLSIGEGTCIESDCTLLCPGAPMTLGTGCYLNRNVRLGSNGSASFTMGDNVMIGPNVVMDTSRHNDARIDIPMKAQGLSYAPIIIGDDVWIGANVVITCGITVGRGSIVGAGAVVTRDVPPYSMVAGVPARVIRQRS
jgi:galactoside O-acetyltransferase